MIQPGGLALALVLAVALPLGPAEAGRSRPLQRLPHVNSVFSAGPIAPNGALVRDGDQLRTLELGELAPTHLRLTFRF